MVFVDDDLGFSLTESVLSIRTRTAMIQCKTHEEAFGFAAKAGFPDYGLIVRPVCNKDPGVIFKGIRDHRSLEPGTSYETTRALEVSTNRRRSVNFAYTLQVRWESLRTGLGQSVGNVEVTEAAGSLGKC